MLRSSLDYARDDIARDDNGARVAAALTAMLRAFQKEEFQGLRR